MLEYDLQLLLTDLKHIRVVNEKCAIYLVINATPCTLQLENKVGLKLFAWLLCIGLLVYNRLGLAWLCHKQ
jgi:hypothetical protein